MENFGSESQWRGFVGGSELGGRVFERGSLKPSPARYEETIHSKPSHADAGSQENGRAGDGQVPEGGERPPEGGEQPPGGEEERPFRTDDYDPVAAATAEYQKLEILVQEFTREVQQLRAELREAATLQSGQEPQLESAAQALSEVQQMRREVAEMLQRGAGQDPGLGFSAAAHVASARSNIKYAKKRWPGRLWDAAWDTLRRMFPLLWSIIGNLVKVKEWTVGGQIGTGVLGIAQASISVTFG